MTPEDENKFDFEGAGQTGGEERIEVNAETTESNETPDIPEMPVASSDGFFDEHTENVGEEKAKSGDKEDIGRFSFDPQTGRPIGGNFKFDPYTGKPLEPPKPRFDPYTGKPLENGGNNFDPYTGKPTGDGQENPNYFGAGSYGGNPFQSGNGYDGYNGNGADGYRNDYQSNNQYGYQNGGFKEPDQKPKSNGFGIASLICGIISLVCSCGLGLSIILSILAIVFGAIQLKNDKNGMAIGGIVTGAIGIVLSIIIIAALAFNQSIAVPTVIYDAVTALIR